MAGGICSLVSSLLLQARAVLVVQIVLIVSEDGETSFAAICFAVFVKTGQPDAFNSRHVLNIGGRNGGDQGKNEETHGQTGSC